MIETNILKEKVDLVQTFFKFIILEYSPLLIPLLSYPTQLLV